MKILYGMYRFLFLLLLPSVFSPRPRFRCMTFWDGGGIIDARAVVYIFCMIFPWDFPAQVFIFWGIFPWDFPADVKVDIVLRSKRHRIGDRGHRIGDRGHRIGDRGHRIGDRRPCRMRATCRMSAMTRWFL
ncbi:hypothetical protein U1Q18_050454 [Sarracenia purpurea var. burkii]